MRWLDARDMLADGLIQGAILRALLHNVINECRHKTAHGALTHVKQSVCSTTKLPEEAPAEKFE